MMMEPPIYTSSTWAVKNKVLLDRIRNNDPTLTWINLENNQIGDANEHSGEKQLLESWINCLRGKDNDLTYIFIAMDRLLQPFNSSDSFCLYFIDRMIQYCFQQGIYSLKFSFQLFEPALAQRG